MEHVYTVRRPLPTEMRTPGRQEAVVAVYKLGPKDFHVLGDTNPRGLGFNGMPVSSRWETLQDAKKAAAIMASEVSLWQTEKYN
ncbi:MAG: hypothetical protein HYU56_00635 [Candidatus Aenigmarchaeota archaeon]|nr:hypothetical protein [Candidatus Aenigmarchaeota archaeon]